MARLRIKAATAVAARIVKNQYNRFPRKRNGFERLGFSRDAAGSERFRAVGVTARRRGEIQGKIV
jgi:hypothetical protein